MSKSSPDNRSGKTIDITELPLVVTDISVQKKNSNRFSLFHRQQFLMGVSSKTLVDFSLQKGVELTPSLFKKLTDSEEYQSVKESGLRYLGRRDHSSSELQQKLLKKGYPQKHVENVVQELAQKGYINDAGFAQKFATEKAELNRWGPKKIAAALYKKGLPKKIVDQVVKNVRESLPQQQICVDLALKRKNHFLREQDPYKRQQKIYRFLAGRGFNGEEIKKSLPRISALIDA